MKEYFQEIQENSLPAIHYLLRYFPIPCVDSDAVFIRQAINLHPTTISSISLALNYYFTILQPNLLVFEKLSIDFVKQFKSQNSTNTQLSV